MRKPLYMEVAEEIKRRISDGIYKPEEKLTSEPTLAKELGISRGTLREALTCLENEGIISRIHGRGSFVNKNPDKVLAGIEKLDSLISTIRQAGHIARDKVINLDEITIDKKVAKLLEVEPNSPGYLIESLRYADDIPVIYCYDILPGYLFDKKDILKTRYRCESLTEFFEKHTKYSPQKFITTVNATLPSNHVAKLLQVTSGEPMIYLEGVMYSACDTIINYGYQYYRSDKYQFKLVRSK